MSGSISIVIPTINEEDELPETLIRVAGKPEIREVIVADGGSSDRTLEIAEMLGCETATCAKASRGGQIRVGCEAASGKTILILHADTWLPENAGNAIERCLENPAVVGGAFWKEFRGDTRHWLMRGSRTRCLLRLAFFDRLMGDQGIFVRRRVLEKIGGFPDVPLMEEFILCEMLSKSGELRLADATVTTSTRKYEKLGVLRTYLLMWEITLRHLMGESPERLHARYYRSRKRQPI